MLPLERYRGSFGIVFIVGIRLPGCLDDAVKVTLKPREPRDHRLPLRAEKSPRISVTRHRSCLPPAVGWSGAHRGPMCVVQPDKAGLAHGS